jgi:hypothetical protein
LRGRFFNVVDLVNRLETETRQGKQGRIADSPNLSANSSSLLGRTDVLKTGGKISLRRYFLIVLRDLLAAAHSHVSASLGENANGVSHSINPC